MAFRKTSHGCFSGAEALIGEAESVRFPVPLRAAGIVNQWGLLERTFGQPQERVSNSSIASTIR